ncbi:hypothetical protein GCM10009007_12580 [Formosimonas limnophila]|uniref:Uncharacterized protein n=1 Tax=Formosimonas limnophila TaxID=1384487 RepID=A0A8J3FZY4_9BURK|nr:STY0301 family protein [Formosimonas limnophila]GHA73183.1 hypothetical protein GCM10009007_12580 [Formosimonas limnophila]
MTSKLYLSGICALVAAGASFSAWSAELCPAEIKTTQNAVDVPTDYEITEAEYGSHRLQSIIVYDGLVKDMASLVPDFQKKNIARWSFSKQSSSQAREVACHYSRTRIVLTKALPVGVESCTATFDPSILIDGDSKIKSFNCK